MNIPKKGIDRHNWDQVSIRGAYALATWLVDRPTAVEVRTVLEPLLNWRHDRQMPLRAFQVGLAMIGILDVPSHHRQIYNVLRSLPFEMQHQLGARTPKGNSVSYRVIEKGINQIARILCDPPVLVDHDHPLADEETGEVLPCPVRCPYMEADATWFVTAMALAAIPDGIPVAKDLALDWTDMPGWGKQLFRFENDLVVAEGDDELDYHGEAAEREAKAAKKAKDPTKVAPIGPDGRKVPSKDSESRWGHRSVRSGVDPFYIGFAAHTALGVPEMDGTRRPAFVHGAEIRPAGSYAGDAAVHMFRTMRYFGLETRDLVADRGYTALRPDGFSRPILEIVGNVVLDLIEHQARKKADWTVIRDKGKPTERTIRIGRIAGGYFTDGLPKTLEGLRRPGPNADKAARLASMAKCDRRAQYAFVHHDFTNAGTERLAGPATHTAGYRVNCVNNRRPGSWPAGKLDLRPRTSCKKGIPCSCGEVLVIADPDSERERQEHLWGTTEWTTSFNRRTVVERGYSDDKFHITSLNRAHIRCFGTVKHAIYYAPIVAARNLQIALRWYYDTDQTDPWDIQSVSRPDYRFPEEPALASEPESNDDSPELAALISAAAEPKAKKGLAPTLVLEAPAAPPLNRKQRRVAERSASSGRRANSKPPKPPPRSTPPPDRQ
ncbi:MAG: hypothetical protein M3256_03480 [Actinomycetota bacterium]|nr:hypothetical protein [Actinomycetota bacterium]